MHNSDKQTGNNTHSEQDTRKQRKEESSMAQTSAPLNEGDAITKDQSGQQEKSAGSNTAIPLRGDETIGNP